MRGVRKTAERMDERGITLVELLTAISIGVMILGVAVALVYGLFSTFHKTTDDFELKSEANRIMNAITSGSTNATNAIVKTNEILFTDDPDLHRFYLTTIPGHTQKALYYDKTVESQTDTFLLSDHVSSLKITAQNMKEGELTSIPIGTEQPINGNDADPLLKLEITLQNDNRSHIFIVTVKLLRASKPTLPP